MIIPKMLMAFDKQKNKYLDPLKNETGVMLAAVLIFISLLLPVTLVILNTMQIETLLPTNEGFARIASHEADKGFDMAIAALVENNQDGFTAIRIGPGGQPQLFTCIADPTRPFPENFPIMGDNEPYFVPGMAKTRHGLDYLAEPWARHPDNYTYFLAERSRENEFHPEFNPDPVDDEDIHSIPARWTMMNVPFGLDNHGERSYDDLDNQNILVNFSNTTDVGPVSPIDAYAADTDDDDKFQSPPLYVHTNWWESPGQIGKSPRNYLARPASFFRNINPADASTTSTLDNQVIDALVYTPRYDDGGWGEDNRNQYLFNPMLQQAVLNSRWANIHFGSGARGARNLEYKPLPGLITQYPVGSTGDEFIPAWFETIVSDESSRFNLNTILNIIFQGANYDYNFDNNSIRAPIIRIDDYGENRGTLEQRINDIISNPNHPNYSNYLLARDMVAALLITDPITEDKLDSARVKAQWILRNMLIVRDRLDRNYDADGDGEADEIDIKNEFNDDFIYNAILNGRGRMGDGRTPAEGTWQIYENPKDFLSDPGRRGYANRISMSEFRVLNQNTTLYTYETEHIADMETSPAFADPWGYRVNFNQPAYDSGLLEDLLVPEIGYQRYLSLLRWRDGLVDLTGDGKLNREYILQPLKDPEFAELATNLTDDQPVSQITYRERYHPNFQDPSNPEFPSMLNVPDLGSLMMVPMSVRRTQIVASANAVELRRYDPNVQGQEGTFIPNTEDGLSSDIDFTGTRLLFDTMPNLQDIASVNPLTGDEYVEYNTPTGYHPSWSPDGTRFLYVDNTNADDQRLAIYNVITDTIQTNVVLSPVPLARISFPPPTPGGDFMQAPSPDWSPFNQIAFAGGGKLNVDFGDLGALFADHTDIYTVRLAGPGAGMANNITHNQDGQYAFYPAFSPDGTWIAYTMFDFLDTQWFKLVLQELTAPHRTEVIYSSNSLIPMAPSWDPRGNHLCFMGLPLTVPFIGFSDIYTISRYEGATPVNITNTPDIAEMFPTWGWANTVPASQGDDDYGNARGYAITFPDWEGLAIDIDDPDITRDHDFRRALAGALQHASLAFRENLGHDEYQNWRYMDLPVVPQHVVDPLMMIADAITFRNPYSQIEDDELIGRAPQAYPAKININTAPRSVLRALFLLMFQGAIVEWDYDHGSAPMAYVPNVGVTPINLAYRDSNATVDQDKRFIALKIADAYAHQVDEYRRWIYNNQSRAFDFSAYDGGSHSYSITRETVPNNLTFPIVGGRLGKNYRANPFAPWDLDNNQYTQDRPLYDPEPPFRSIADLFNVALYSGDTNESWFNQRWFIQGYYGSHGPDPEETIGGRNVIPTAFTLDDPTDPMSGTYENFGDDRYGPNTLAAWGPVFQTDYAITRGIAGLDDSRVDPYFTGDTSMTKSPGSLYYNQQRFRLFKADDFKWISPYITTRSYVYRIESRGTVRVSSGAQKLDISRDKLWIVDFGQDTYINRDTTGNDNFNERVLINGNQGYSPYVVRLFEEIPPDGVPLTRKQFRPPRI